MKEIANNSESRTDSLVSHNLEPIFDSNSKILILGTMPSPKSRKDGFYYSHPQNRFWKVLAAVFNQNVPETTEEKKQFLLDNRVALWDVLKSCKIKNADDNSISEPVANDIAYILNRANIKAVFTTGKKATDLYNRYCVNETNRLKSVYLPSTSPANCKLKLEDIIESYRVILSY